MRLIRLIPEAGSPADLFISRYKWLLRWAMHFARNDRATAEDLMQDTFLRFCQANVKVAEIRDPEALLYTYLEYVHLARMREVKRHSFISLADAKLDALGFGLLAGPDVDRIETQNVLRRIAAYVSWRKQTSKSASIVALRFFHGYLPEEIASIALVSREAVDERLHKGRNEIRLHLLDAEKLRGMQHGGPIEIFPSKIVVPTDALLAELRDQLFRACHGTCISREQLMARYRNNANTPIQRDLLAHIVCCPQCLDAVEQICRKKQRSGTSGGAGGSFGMNKRAPHKDIPLSSAKGMEIAMWRTERRLKEIFEHRPTSLIVAVNGEILASRDVGASFNGLKVEVLTQNLRFIEILNEHGVSLLSWAVESAPPYSDPVVHREAEFSMGRRLGVDLQFSTPNPVIEIEYCDPSYREIPLSSLAAAGSMLEEEDDVEAEPATPQLSRVNLLKQWRERWAASLIVTGLVCALLLAIALTARWRNSDSVRPAEFLQRAAASERRDAQSAESGVILQQVSIRSSEGSFERSIYRDPRGKRHMKEQSLDAKKVRLKKRLAEAGIDWDAPLSAASFQEWQAHSHIKNESVRSVGEKFLTLRVDTEGSDVDQETITIRASDFHPVGRTAEFRDLGTVEIAELNYTVVPWTTINQNIFASDSAGPGQLVTAPRSLSLPQRPRPVLDSELDLTELEVRTALHELHTDFTDRLTVSRSMTGIQVDGLVEDDEQRAAVKRRLAFIPRVFTNLVTLGEASARAGKPTQPASVHLMSVVAGPSLLETFLLEQGRTRDASSELADRFFAASAALVRANNALVQLQQRFPPEKLSPDARELYNRLTASWRGELNAALRKESEAIQQTGIQIPAEETTRAEASDMTAGIDNNRALLKELIGHDAPGTRAAPVVLADLARSVESLQKVASNQQEKAVQTTSSSVPSASNIHP